jgi:hypothetical protein
MSARRCSICSNAKKNEWVAKRHLEGFSASKMEEMARANGHPIKRETIAKHLKVCIGSDAKPAEVKAVAETVTKNASVSNDTVGSEDVAVLVQREVVRKLKAGEGRVTVQHGLQAQQLLDRRAERAKDRELAITLARLLHSPAPPASAITARPVDVIEGHAVEVGSGDQR